MIFQVEVEGRGKRRKEVAWRKVRCYFVPQSKYRMEIPQTSMEAAEQLRAIRSLMERSTVYRAISAPAALVAGLVALGLSGWQWGREGMGGERFMVEWLVVLVVMSVLNVELLRRSAAGRGEPFVSAGMKLALRAIAPPMIGGFVLSVVAVWRGDGGVEAAGMWILFYGLGLLAAASFAPRSMKWLGRAFFGAGLVSCVVLPRVGGAGHAAAVGSMAVTFGMFHVVYAAAVFVASRASRADKAGGA